MKYLGRDWLANNRAKGSGGAHAALLNEAPEEEPIVYLRVDTCVGNRYRAMHRGVLVDFIKDDKHAFEVIPTSRKRKFYMEFDHEVPDNGQVPEEH